MSFNGIDEHSFSEFSVQYEWFPIDNDRRLEELTGSQNARVLIGHQMVLFH